MAIDLYKTSTMLAAVNQMEPVHTFLRDRYFPFTDADIFPGDSVLMEIKNGSIKMAPVVLPRKGSITVEREGYTTERMTPPLVAPSRPLTIEDLNKKGFGENLFSDRDPADREAEILGNDLVDMDDMVSMREEYIAAECMFKNGYVLKQYADKYGSSDYIEYELRFYDESTNPAEYTPGVDWDATGSNKMGDVAAMIPMLTEAGNNAVDLILGADAAEEWINDAKIKELMDIASYNFGNIAPIQLDDPAAALLGRVNIRGRMINLITYDGTYTDEATGNRKVYVPAKSICLTAPAAGRSLYGAVTQVEQDLNTYTRRGRRVPKVIADPKTNVKELIMSSRPLLIPRTKNPFISAKVID